MPRSKNSTTIIALAAPPRLHVSDVVVSRDAILGDPIRGWQDDSWRIAREIVRDPEYALEAFIHRDDRAVPQAMLDMIRAMVADRDRDILYMTAFGNQLTRLYLDRRSTQRSTLVPYDKSHRVGLVDGNVLHKTLEVAQGNCVCEWGYGAPPCSCSRYTCRCHSLNPGDPTCDVCQQQTDEMSSHCACMETTCSCHGVLIKYGELNWQAYSAMLGNNNAFADVFDPIVQRRVYLTRMGNGIRVRPQNTLNLCAQCTRPCPSGHCNPERARQVLAECDSAFKIRMFLNAVVDQQLPPERKTMAILDAIRYVAPACVENGERFSGEGLIEINYLKHRGSHKRSQVSADQDARFVLCFMICRTALAEYVPGDERLAKQMETWSGGALFVDDSLDQMGDDDSEK